MTGFETQAFSIRGFNRSPAIKCPHCPGHKRKNCLFKFTVTETVVKLTDNSLNISLSLTKH